jgi:hypothetical protein
MQMPQDIPRDMLTMRTQDGHQGFTGALSTLNNRPVARIRIPSAKAVAPRKYVVASGRMPASAVPVRADTNTVPT